MTDQESAKIMLLLKAAFPRDDGWLDERTVEIRDGLFREQMRPLSFEVGMEAVRECMRTLKRFPVWADFVRAYGECNRPRPELAGSQRYLPAPGDTTASVEEVAAVVQRVTEKLSVEARPRPKDRAERGEPVPAEVFAELDALKGRAPVPGDTK